MRRRFAQSSVGGVDVRKLFSDQELASQDGLVAALERRLLQSKLKAKQEKALRDYLDGEGELNDQTVLNAIRLVMATPEYQLT
ncbi:MAG TPA: hypothetical protein VG146_01165 [Verrucomicrobiae bacterium]|nr:hypothetical protein [Verrucomicrobiae bacterium]